MTRERIKKIIKITVIALVLLFLVFSIFLYSVSTKEASHNRKWWKSLSVLPRAELINNKITIEGVRDWTYDEVGPVTNTRNWINVEYDIRDLERVWFFFVPFSDNKKLAHTMLSFDFKDKEPLSISIEARKEFGEKYKLIDSLLNEFELIYIWGTEKDFIGDRVLSRGDTVYMYPLDVSKEFGQELLIDLFKRTNEIYSEPEFYNTLFTNCTNDLAKSANRVKPDSIPMSLARVLPGYSFDLLFDLGYIDDEGNKEEVREKYNITEITKETVEFGDFSKRLRNALGF